MEINANVTNAVAASISKINLNSTQRGVEPKRLQTEAIVEEAEKIPEIKPEKSNIDVEDIQKYAKYMGENLSIDDINYGLMYGRSVIIDFSV